MSGMGKASAGVAALGLAMLACAASGAQGFGDQGQGGDDSGASGDDAGTFGGDAGRTFGSKCSGTPTVLKGTVRAPNGADPLPKIYVYSAAQTYPFPPANYCNQCGKPLDAWYDHTQSNDDGTFSLDVSDTPAGDEITFVVNVGRFRKVTKLPVKGCSTNVVPSAAATLPGRSSDGDIPKIAVGSGASDHLDQILSSALGITEYDCYNGHSGGSSTPTCQPVDTVANLLSKQSAKTVDDYHIVFLSCAPGTYAGYAGAGVDTTKLSANTKNYVSSGGRLFATDMSYDYVAQPFPADITWMGPSGTPQPVDGANVGVAGSYAGNVDDPDLKAWLQALGVPTNPTVPLTGFLSPWSVQASLPKTSKLVVDATVSTSSGSSDVPLTTQFDVNDCGRVVYSSYHTASGYIDPHNLKPQERILEYLIFSVASCVDPTPK